MKIAVVTSSVNTNNLIEPENYFDKVDYHAFVDESKMSDKTSWILHKAFDFSSDPVYRHRRNAKIYKILPFLFLPEYDYYFWIDSTHMLKYDPYKIIKKYLKNSDIAVFKHNQRDCIYDEGKEIKKINFDHVNLVEDQLNFYRDMEYPEHNGLYELPVRVQKNTELTQRMGLMWWENICMFSSRDQLSFPYVCHKLNMIPEILPGCANGINGNKFIPQIVYSNHSRINNV